MLNWPDFTLPPINLLVMARLDKEISALSNKKGRKELTNRPSILELHQKRSKG